MEGLHVIVIAGAHKEKNAWCLLNTNLALLQTPLTKFNKRFS